MAAESLGEEEGKDEGTPASKHQCMGATEPNWSGKSKEGNGILAKAAISMIEDDLDKSKDNLDEIGLQKLSQPKNCLAFATAFYSINSYDYYKSNQLHAFWTISEDVFKGVLTPEQLMSGNKHLLQKYKIYKELMEQTGMGTALDKAIQAYLMAQGYHLKARTIQNFGDSDVYNVMHEVLQTNPSILKLISLDPSHAISLVGIEINNGYAGSDKDDSNRVEVLDPAPVRQSGNLPPTAETSAATSKSLKHSESIIDVDPTSDSTADHYSKSKPQKQNSLPKKNTPDDPLMATMKESMNFMKEVVAKTSAKTVWIGSTR